MQLIFSGKQDVYLEIAEKYTEYIKIGVFKNGEKLPSVREAAGELGVNPNTIQKAYHMLEEEHIILSRAGAKSCVTIDETKKDEIRRELLRKETLLWVQAMKQMKVSKDEAEAMVKEIWEVEEA